METVGLYQKFLRELWQLIQDIALPVAVVCLVLLGIAASLFAAYFLGHLVKPLITNKKRLNGIRWGCIILTGLVILDVHVTLYYYHRFLISHFLFCWLIVYFWVSYAFLRETLSVEVDRLMSFRTDDYLAYLESLQVGDKVTMFNLNKDSLQKLYPLEFEKPYSFERGWEIVDKKELGFALKKDESIYRFDFDPLEDYNGNDWIIFPETSYHLFLVELHKERRYEIRWFHP